MWGTLPVFHWWAKRVRSSCAALRVSRWASPTAINAESQLHWCGYSHGAARVHPPISFRRRILPACATSSSCSSEIFPHECVRTRCSTCVTIVIYSTAGVVDGVSSMCYLHACERSQVDVEVAQLCSRDLFLVLDQRYRAPQIPAPIDRHCRKYPPVL